MSVVAMRKGADPVCAAPASSESLRELLDGRASSSEVAAQLFGLDPSTLTPDEQVTYAQCCQRLINTLTARQDDAIVAFMGASPRDIVWYADGDEHVLADARALELQLALGWGEGFTRSRIDTARTMRTELPLNTALATAGQMQPIIAKAIAEGARTLAAGIDEAIEHVTRAKADPDELAAMRAVRASLLATYDERIAAFLPSRSLQAVGRKVRDTIARLDPAGVLARRAKAVRLHSDVRVQALPDGMACLMATMPAEQALACLRVLDLAAHDPRREDAAERIGLRRTRALYERITRSGDDAPGATDRGLPVHLDVVMPLDASLGLSDADCAVPGAGGIPAVAIRELLADAAWVKVRRVLTDTRTGHVLDLGVRRYRLTPAEQERIAMRDRHCRMPDCSAPAYRCECDHALAYGAGGASRTSNLGLLCKRHHQHKTHAGWQIVDSSQDGSCTWRSPLGREYQHEPEPLLSPSLEHASQESVDPPPHELRVIDDSPW